MDAMSKTTPEPEVTIPLDEEGIEELTALAKNCDKLPELLSKQTYAPEVSGFCERHGILSHVADATGLVKQCFPSRKTLRLFLGDDPEEEGQWIIIEVTVNQDVDDFLKEYNRCVDLWVKMIPAEALSIIRLSYKLA
jgi:hypothetical protein